MPRSRMSCPVHGSGGTLLTLANCLSTTVSITLSTIPVEAPDCHSGVGWPSVDHVAIYPHESGTAPHFLALPEDADSAGVAQPVFLAGDILVNGRYAGIAKNIATAGRLGRLFNARFGDTLEMFFPASVQGPQVVSLFVSIR